MLGSHIGKLMLPLAVEPRSAADFYSLSVSLWNDLANPVSDSVGLAGFQSRANDFLLAYATLSSLSSSIILFFLSLLSDFRLVLWGWGRPTDRV